MEPEFGTTGVMNVNGAWVTRLRFEAEIGNSRAAVVHVRFMQGNAEVERAVFDREQALALLGERNLGEIDKLVGQRKPEEGRVRGELDGQRLTYREVVLPDAALGVGASAPEVPNEVVGLVEASRPDADHDPRAMPASVAAKFLREGNRYYFDDRTLAFIDGGNQLRAETENRAVIKDLVAVAKARQWDHIEVRGSEIFRREVWKEAHAEGMAVTGFAPTPLERQTAARERGRQYAAPDRAATPTPASDLKAAANAHSMPWRRRWGNPAAEVVYGRLIDYGAAPYQFDPKNSPSYYVKLDHGDGLVRAYWGVGLAEAVSASQTAVEIGDSVGVRQAGSKPVLVTTRGLDAQGQEVVQEVARQRHDWLVEKVSYFQESGRMARDLAARQEHVGECEPAAGGTPPELAASVNAVVGEQRRRDQQRVTAVRSAARTREELQRNYPELGAAVFSQLAAQQRFADEFVKVGLIREEDRQQVIQAMRERLADQLERGDKIAQVEQKKVMALIHQSVLRAADEVGRTPITGRPDRIAGQVRTPKARVHEDVHVRA